MHAGRPSRRYAAAEPQAVSFDLDEQDTREDVRRIAAASESFADSEKKLVDFLARTDEDIRAQHHHDVLCLVIKKLVGQVSYAGRHVAESNPHASWAEVVSAAREVADLAYPPPKAEP